MRLRTFFQGLILFYSAQVLAVNIIPPSAAPERQTTRPPMAQVPELPEEVITAPLPEQEIDDSAQVVEFLFSGFTIEGATLFTEADFRPIYADKIGEQITLAELYQITEQMETLYTREGYLLTRVIIPEQEIEPGDKIKLRVIEGFVDNIDIQSDSRRLHEFLTKMAQPILASQPLQISTLEQTLLLMNDLPGVSVRSVLSPAKDTLGGSDLVILVEETTYDTFLQIDNRGTVYAGPTQFFGYVALNNLFGVGKSYFETTLASPTRELAAFRIGHIKPIGAHGTRVEVAFNYSEVEPGDDLSPLEVEGYSHSYDLTVYQPLIRSRRNNLTFWMGYDELSSESKALGQRLYMDCIESIRAGVIFDNIDGWHGLNLVGAEISQGINLFTGDNRPPLERSRVDGTKNYTKVNGNVSRLQFLPQQFSVLLSAQGQYAMDALLSAEEFGVGGEYYGLAYDDFEIAGDSGYAGKAELRRDFYPDSWLVSFVQPYVSYDGGEVWQRSADSSQSLTSLGGGLRFDFFDFFSGQLEVAKPLTKKVATEDNKDPRFFFYFSADV